MKKTTFAVIGTGVVGERIIKQIQAHPTCEIVGVYDENEERLTIVASMYQLNQMATLHDLLALQADWVYIGTPPMSHYVLAAQVAERGSNILCEKPLAHDAKEGEQMVAVADKYQVKTAMHFPMMYSAAVQTLKEKITQGELGDILRIEFQAYFPVWPRPWQQNPWIATRAQGGFIREIFPHYLQLTHHLFGDIVFTAHQTNYPLDETQCETAAVAIGMVQKIPLLCNAITQQAGKEKLTYTIYGTKQNVTIQDWADIYVTNRDGVQQQIEPTTTDHSLLNAIIHAKNTVTFAEGAKIQHWIDELLQG